MQHPHGEAEAAVLPDRGTDHALDREQSHLGVVGDAAVDACALDTLGQIRPNAVPSAFGLDPVEAPELDRATERVADGPAQQAASHARAIALELVSLGRPASHHERHAIGEALQNSAIRAASTAAGFITPS